MVVWCNHTLNLPLARLYFPTQSLMCNKRKTIQLQQVLFSPTRLWHTRWKSVRQGQGSAVPVNRSRGDCC